MTDPSEMTAASRSSLQSLMGDWDGEEVIVRFDQPAGAWIVIAIHSIHSGRAGGGTRMKSYPDLHAAVADALRLSAGMTAKFAITDLASGGGKAVIAVPLHMEAEARTELLRRYGVLIHQLRGLFHTAPDVGTAPADMDIIAETGAPYVFCRTPERGGSGDAGPPTALGVFCAIRTTAKQLFGSDSLAGRTILVQGAGNVGGPLLRLLAGAGAHVVFTDVNPAAVRRMQEQIGGQAIAPELVYDMPCDIFAPYALGGILNRSTIPRLRCRGVAGSANNQLESPGNALALKERGIPYAPDFVANLGGAMAILGLEDMGWSREEADRRIAETVTGALHEIFETAAAEDITTVEAAERIVRQRRSQ